MPVHCEAQSVNTVCKNNSCLFGLWQYAELLIIIIGGIYNFLGKMESYWLL
jgi:hypothetical protein